MRSLDCRQIQITDSLSQNQLPNKSHNTRGQFERRGLFLLLIACFIGFFNAGLVNDFYILQEYVLFVLEKLHCPTWRSECYSKDPTVIKNGCVSVR